MIYIRGFSFHCVKFCNLVLSLCVGCENNVTFPVRRCLWLVLNEKYPFITRYFHQIFMSVMIKPVLF